MKAREIREALQHNTDPKLVHCLSLLAETVSAQQEEIDQLAEIQNKCIDLIMQLGVSVEGAKNAVDVIKSIRGED